MCLIAALSAKLGVSPRQVFQQAANGFTNAEEIATFRYSEWSRAKFEGKTPFIPPYVQEFCRQKGVSHAEVQDAH